MSEHPDEKDDEAADVGGFEIAPAEGEQERSHESEETLSPDEKTVG